MSALVDHRASADEIGPLAARVGITPAEAAAVKRHAGRLEASGDLQAALDAWRIAIKLTPGDVRAWDAVARCLSGLGQEALAGAVTRAADVLRRRS